MTSTHPCDACSGTGSHSLTVAYGDVRPGDRIWNRHGYSSPIGHWTEVLTVTCDGPQHGLTTRDGYKQWGWSHEGLGVQRSCPVCLGAGRFSDRMPARDALADAETLLSALKVCKHDTVQCYVDGAWASARASAGEIEPSGMWAERAARAAFRAVPGLRGEE